MTNSILRPAIYLSRRLNFKEKFLLIFVVSVIPGLLFLLLSLKADWNDIERDRSELEGMQYISLLTPIVYAVSDHRSSTALVLNGDASAKAQASKEAEVVNRLLQQLQNETPLTHAEQWQGKITEVVSRWRSLEQSWSGMSASATSLAHIEVIGLVDEFRHHVAGDTGLLLDPDASAYYLMTTVVDSLPALRELLQQLRGSLSSTLAAEAVGDKRKGRMESTVQRELPRALRRINNDLELVGDVAPLVAQPIAAQWRDVETVLLAISQQLLEKDFNSQFDKGPVQAQLRQMDDALVALLELESEMTKKLEQALRSRMGEIWVEFYVLLALGFLVLLLMGALISGFGVDVSQRASLLETDMDLLAKGDFSVCINDRGDDELSKIAHSAVKLSQQLGGTICNVRDCANQLIDIANNIAAASTQLASSAEQQSYAATSMAAAMEEMTVNVTELSGSAQGARAQTEVSAQASNVGSKVIQDTVQSMQNIAATVREASGSVVSLGDDAKAISSIVGVIRGIADQTNLLALNAAIEAARAGETGRGFAVVADEVRSLAARTAASTQEITQMIERIQAGTGLVVTNMERGTQQVEQGVLLATEAGSAIASISERSGAIEQMVHGMTKALGDQATAATEVAHQVELLARMSDENAHSTKLTAQSSRDLKALVSVLENKVSQFRF